MADSMLAMDTLLHTSNTETLTACLSFTCTADLVQAATRSTIATSTPLDFGSSPTIKDQLHFPDAYSAGDDPKPLIENNTPELLVDDNNKMREHLNIDRWHIFGGSWGATLALLYAEKYPERTLSLTLRGVFMMRDKELDWYLNGTGTFYPEVHQEFVEFLPESERENLLESYFQRLTNPDPKIHLAAAAAWTRYENGYSHLDVPSDEVRNMPPEQALPFALIEAHYMRNFMPTNVIMENLDPIKDMPTHIVQGRHDVCCPPMSAYDLSQALDQCTLEFTQAGHSGGMPENVRGLVAAANRILATGSPIKR